LPGSSLGGASATAGDAHEYDLAGAGPTFGVTTTHGAGEEGEMEDLEWEDLEEAYGNKDERVMYAEVPGGWLVRVLHDEGTYERTVALAFVPEAPRS